MRDSFIGQHLSPDDLAGTAGLSADREYRHGTTAVHVVLYYEIEYYSEK
jgi:hypothetical protein